MLTTDAPYRQCSSPFSFFFEDENAKEKKDEEERDKNYK